MPGHSSVVPFRSRQQLCEWVGGRYQFEENVKEGSRIFRPEVVMWLALPDDFIVQTALYDPDRAVPFEQTLIDAMNDPKGGGLRPPARIRVQEETLAAAVRGVVGADVQVIVAPIPELDAVFAEMSQATRDEPSEMSYLHGGVTSETMGDLFEAAAAVYGIAPWKTFSDADTFAVAIPSGGIEEGCLTIIGAARESYGMLLFRSFEAYAEFAERGAQLEAGLGPEDIEPVAGAGTEAMLLSLSFDRKTQLTSTMRHEIAHYRWRVAGSKAFPTLFALGDDCQSTAAGRT